MAEDIRGGWAKSEDHALQAGGMQNVGEGVAWGQPESDESTAKAIGADYSRARVCCDATGDRRGRCQSTEWKTQAGGCHGCPSTRAGPEYSQRHGLGGHV